MAKTTHRSEKSWYRGRGGRRFGIEFASIILIKLVLLGLLWFLVIKPQPSADTSPDAIQQHFTTPQRMESRP